MHYLNQLVVTMYGDHDYDTIVDILNDEVDITYEYITLLTAPGGHTKVIIQIYDPVVAMVTNEHIEQVLGVLSPMGYELHYGFQA